MAIDVKLKRSHTHSTIQTTSNLVEGEVAINTHDRKMFMRDGSSAVVTVSDHYATAFESSAQTLYVTVAASTAAHPYNGTGSSNKYKINGVFSPFLKLIPKNTYKFDQSDSSNSGHPLRFYLDAAKNTAYTTGVTSSGTPGNSGAYTQIVVAENAPSVLYYQCTAHGYMGWAATTNTIGTTDTITEGSTNLYHTTARVQAISINALSEDTAPALAGNLDVVTHKIVSTTNRNIDIEPHGTGNVLLGNFTFDADQSVGSGQDNYVMTYDHSAGTIGLEAAASGGGASNTFKTIAVSGQSDVVADSSTDTLTLVAGSNITLTTNAGTDSITIASSGGGGGSAITVKDEGSALSTAASSLNFVGASVTASGTGADKTITISDPTYQVTNTIKETFTGNGSTSAFTLSNIFTTDGAVVFYNGQHLTPTTDYSISGTTLTFTFTPVNASEIVVRNMGTGRVKLDKFTGNGSTTAFTLTNSYVNIDQFMVFANGSLLVPSTDYTFNTGTSVLTFTYTPANNDEINVRGVGENAVVGNRYTYVATGNQTAFTGADAASQTLSFLADNLEVFLNGSKLNKQQGDFTVSGGNTVTLATGASASDILEILVFDSYAVADALKISNNLSDLNNVATARTNLGISTYGSTLIDDADAAAARTTLGLGDAATKTVGIGTGNLGTFASSVADDDFLRIDGTTIEGRSASELLSDISAAPLASPALTGTPTAPTASAGTNNTQIATTAYVDAAAGSGSSGPSFLLRQSNASSYNSGSYTVILQNGDFTSLHDTDNACDANGLFTVPAGKGGLYMFNWGLTLKSLGNNYLATQLKIDGSSDNSTEQYFQTNITNVPVKVAQMVKLTAGQTVIPQVLHASGSTLADDGAGSRKGFFGGFKIG